MKSSDGDVKVLRQLQDNRKWNSVSVRKVFFAHCLAYSSHVSIPRPNSGAMKPIIYIWDKITGTFNFS